MKKCLPRAPRAPSLSSLPYNSMPPHHADQPKRSQHEMMSAYPRHTLCGISCKYCMVFTLYPLRRSLALCWSLQGANGSACISRQDHPPRFLEKQNKKIITTIVGFWMVLCGFESTSPSAVANDANNVSRQQEATDCSSEACSADILPAIS